MSPWKAKDAPSLKEIHLLVEEGIVERNVCKFCKITLHGKDFCSRNCETAAAVSVILG